MRLIYSMVIAFSTYSRLPMPQVEWSEENRKYSMCFFPLIGAMIGGLLWLWLLICEKAGFGAMLKGSVGAILPLLISGGIHMDGFMDTTDALNSWQPKEKKLEILKDSHVGAFAVLACISYLLLMAALLSEAERKNGAQILCVFVASRAMSAWALSVFKSARPGGMLDKFVEAAKKRAITVSTLMYLIGCLTVWSLTNFAVTLICVTLTVFGARYYRHMAYKQFGGVTGDLAGWYSQTTELVLIMVIVIGGKLL